MQSLWGSYGVAVPRVAPTEDDRRAAVQELLEGLAAGDPVDALVGRAATRHPTNDTFPGEAFLDVARDALQAAGASRSRPFDHVGFVSAHLPEVAFRGRENARIRFALLAAAAGRGGLAPDLLDEVMRWNTDDFWRYGLLAAVACIRAAAHRRGVPVDVICGEIAPKD